MTGKIPPGQVEIITYLPDMEIWKLYSLCIEILGIPAIKNKS